MASRYIMNEEDILFCKELSAFQKENKGKKFDEFFPTFKDKLWELSKKYHLNPADAFAIYISNYKQFN